MLSTVFETVKTGLEIILRSTSEPMPRHLLGEEHLPNPGTLPSIVWVPRGAKKIVFYGSMHAPTAVKLTRRVPGQPVQPNDDTGRIDSPQQLATRDEVVHIYVQAGGFRETEILLNHLVACMRVQLTAASFEMLETSWSVGHPAETNENTAQIVPGTMCVLACIVSVPFTFEPQQIVRAGFDLTVTGDIVDTLPAQ